MTKIVFKKFFNFLYTQLEIKIKQLLFVVNTKFVKRFDRIIIVPITFSSIFLDLFRPHDFYFAKSI
jgi:hypothetical protein